MNYTTERQFRNHKELESLDGKYDVIIAGGDQVWNVLCPDADDLQTPGNGASAQRLQKWCRQSDFLADKGLSCSEHL